MFRVKICRFVNLGRRRPVFLATIILMGLHLAASGPARAATPAPDAPPVAPIPALVPVAPMAPPIPKSSAPVVTTTPNAPPRRLRRQGHGRPRRRDTASGGRERHCRPRARPQHR